MDIWPPSQDQVMQTQIPYKTGSSDTDVIEKARIICMTKRIMYTGLNPRTSYRAAHPNLEIAAVKNPTLATFVRYSSLL